MKPYSNNNTHSTYSNHSNYSNKGAVSTSVLCCAVGAVALLTDSKNSGLSPLPFGGVNGLELPNQARNQNVKECYAGRGWNDAQTEALKVVKTGLKRHSTVSITVIVESIRPKKHVFIDFFYFQGSYMPAFLR
jgi:hypothetical protein